MAGNCEFEATLQLLARKHTLTILRVLAVNSTMCFNEIRRVTRVNPKTLTDRLRELEKEGLVRRSELRKIPREVRYSLSEKGFDLAKVFEVIAAWHRKYSNI
ncbi:MAG: helix-turn-helix transcriptional regulator [Thaumarchaeota archaeon]|jgi:DNA-binding HxlR family transcriptional regulator|nr:helix-turn-helix transcriptional regulator [Nitrososphaerota archaeon]